MVSMYRINGISITRACQLEGEGTRQHNNPETTVRLEDLSRSIRSGLLTWMKGSSLMKMYPPWI